uniref:Uncharacterized protein n=1 Tax=Tanacetum cinerariifolium TaxID=118510 RepID=A0A699JXH4_TANCI|nr:hypothetical protein [Tanacetum cinerariifolium]
MSSSTVIDTSNPPSLDYVPGPKYPEYVASLDDEVLFEDQPLPADASPTALILGYVVDSGLEGDLDEDPEGDHADYPTDGGDDDDDEGRRSPPRRMRRRMSI